MERSLLTKSFAGSGLPGKGSLVRSCILAAAGGAGFSILFSFVPNVEPFWVFAAGIGMVFVILGMIKYPAAFLVPVIFASSFKDSPRWQFLPASVDLTLVCLLALVVIMLFHFLFDLVRPGGWSLRQFFAGQGKGVGLFVLFVGIVVASYLYSPSVNYGWKVASRLCGIGGILFLAPLILVKEEKDLRHFFVTFVFFAMYLATEIVVRLETLNVELIDPHDYASGVTRIGEGWKVAMAILVVLYYRFFQKRAPRLLLIVFCVPWLVVGLVSSASRGAALFLVPAIGLTYLMMGRRRKSLSAVVGGLVVVALVVAIGAASYSWIRHLPSAEEKLQEKEKELGQLSLHGAKDSSSSVGTRLGYYKTALQALPVSPIFGLGVGGWDVYYYGQEVGQHVHNLFLEVAVEEGLLGFAVFLAFLATVVSALKNILRATGDRFVVLLALPVYMLSNLMIVGNLDDARLLWLLCGMALAVSRMVSLGLVEAPTPYGVSQEPRPAWVAS